VIRVKIDAKKALEDLRSFRKKAVPYALRNAVNTAAFEGRKIWQGEIKRSFTLRNQFTTRSIRVEKARNPRMIMAVLGSVAPYMAKQEEGGTVRGRSGKKAIPGPVAAGQRPGAKRTRLVRAGFRLGAIKVPRLRTGSRIQRNAVAIAMAKRRGQKFALLQRPKGGKGLFLLGGGKRKASTKLLYDVSRSSVRVPAAPTLARTMHRMNARTPAIVHAAVLKELRRNKVFGY
jgi:hypothetical protein